MRKILILALLLAFGIPLSPSLSTSETAMADSERERQLRKLQRQLKKLDRHHINKLNHRVDRIFREKKRRNKRAGRKLGEALGKAIAAGILGGAVAHQYRNEDRYWHSGKLSDQENAIGACIHHADKLVRRTGGGLYAKLDRVIKVKENGWHQFVVKAYMTGVYRFGSKVSRVRCVTDGYRVIKFKYD